MDNSPGILFWILAVVCVVSAVITVSARRVLFIAIALVVTILSIMNLMISLGIVGLSIIYAFASLVVLAALYYALKKSGAVKLLSLNIVSHPKPVFYFVISFLFYIGCLILISYTQVWQYTDELKSVSFYDLVAAIRDEYLLPFVLFKSILLILLIITFFNFKRRTA